MPRRMTVISELGPRMAANFGNTRSAMSRRIERLRELTGGYTRPSEPFTLSGDERIEANEIIDIIVRTLDS